MLEKKIIQLINKNISLLIKKEKENNRVMVRLFNPELNGCFADDYISFEMYDQRELFNVVCMCEQRLNIFIDFKKTEHENKLKNKKRHETN